MKFIVFATNLLSLFSHCFLCRSPSDISTEIIGTFLRVKLFCAACSFQYVWESQPLIGNMPAGNLAVCTAIACSGSLPTKALRLFQIMNCKTIARCTYFNYQKNYTCPAIQTVWTDHQNDIISMLHTEKKPLVLGGDARCDSPGFCAKFGSYTLLELDKNLIVDIELVQVSYDFIFYLFIIL